MTSKEALQELELAIKNKSEVNMSKSIKALKRISTIIGSSEPNYYFSFTNSAIPFKEGINKIMKDLEELEIHTKCRMVKSKDRKI